MNPKIEKQKWSKELKANANVFLGRYGEYVYHTEVDKLIALINQAIEEVEIPNCDDCEDRRRSDEPMHNEGMD